MNFPAFTGIMLKLIPLTEKVTGLPSIKGGRDGVGVVVVVVEWGIISFNSCMRELIGYSFMHLLLRSLKRNSNPLGKFVSSIRYGNISLFLSNAYFISFLVYLDL